MSATGLPFDDIRALFAQMPGESVACVDVARARAGDLVVAAGAMGRLAKLVEWLAAWQGRARPAVTRPMVALFAGSHGVATRVGAAAPADTRAMMETLAAGGGAVNQICAAHDIGLKVFDLALDIPTADIAMAPALDEKAAAATFAFGMEAIAGGSDLLCVGALGAAGEVAATALLRALHPHGQPLQAGLADDDDATRAKKNAAVAAALATHRGALADPLEAMRRLGGREICAIAGAIMAARMERVPVILDGLAAAAAAAVLKACDARAIDHCLAGHVSSEGAHASTLQALGLPPLLDLGLGVTDGTGAALAAVLAKTAATAHEGMATRAQAGLVLN